MAILMKLSEGTSGILVNLKTGEERDWTLREEKVYSNNEIWFDRVRVNNGGISAIDFDGDMFGRIQRWVEQRYIGFREDNYAFLVKEYDVKLI